MLERTPAPHSNHSLGQATGSGPKKSFRLPGNPIIVWPMLVPQEFSPQAEGGRRNGPGSSVPKASLSGVWGGETHGHPGPTHSGFKTSEIKLSGDWWGHHGGVGLKGTAWNLPCRARGEGGALPCTAHEVHCHVLKGCCGSWGRRRDGVCLTTGFNLKHMYWLKFILPA